MPGRGLPEEELQRASAEQRVGAAVADHVEVRHVREVEIAQDQTRAARILFDPGHSLAERVLREQFRF